MGTRTQRIVFDDLDLSTDAVGTYRFSLEGADYEIELTDGHLGDLRAALAPYIGAGRRLRRTVPRPAAVTASASRPGLREWWAANTERLHLPQHRTRGQIPAAVVTAYDLHH
jgi:hypothetical protein